MPSFYIDSLPLHIILVDSKTLLEVQIQFHKLVTVGNIDKTVRKALYNVHWQLDGLHLLGEVHRAKETLN